MCDYSLLCIPNRLAVDGEQLVVHEFPTGWLGLASPADLRTCAPWARWWSAEVWPKQERKPIPAVCVPPGARLFLRDIPERLRQQLGVGAEEEVTFVELSAEAYTFRDAVRFKNGREILLQKLAEGQRVEVLCLSSADSVEEEDRSEVLVGAYQTIEGF